MGKNQEVVDDTDQDDEIGGLTGADCQILERILRTNLRELSLDVLQKRGILPRGKPGADRFEKLRARGYFVSGSRERLYRISSATLAEIKSMREAEYKAEKEKRRIVRQQSAALSLLREIRQELQTHRLEPHDNLAGWLVKHGNGRFKNMKALRVVLNVLLHGEIPYLDLGEDDVYVIVAVPSHWPPLRFQPPPPARTSFGQWPRETELERRKRLARARAKSEADRLEEQKEVERIVGAVRQEGADRPARSNSRLFLHLRPGSREEAWEDEEGEESE